jgi:hypothetical protein
MIPKKFSTKALVGIIMKKKQTVPVTYHPYPADPSSPEVWWNGPGESTKI